jgi:LmbE family N-acetylglucosaminyl deacetylase
MGFEFFRNQDNTRFESSDIGLLFPDWQMGRENVVFVGAHDDDICLGAGLLVQAVNHFQGKAYFLVVTDGRQGYCSEEEKADIYERRVNEARTSASILNAADIVRLDFSDGDLVLHYGTTNQQLIWRLTQAFKDLDATRIVVPTISDAHPDHVYTNEATRICIFHANGGIWDGRKARITTVLESAVYCPFEGAPDLALRTGHEEFERKLNAIHAYESQRQIADLVERVSSGGSIEIFKTLPAPNYSAKEMFAKYFENKSS